MGKVRGAAEGVSILAEDRDDQGQDTDCITGLHKHQGASRWYGCAKKRGRQSVGKSRGGWNTKLHMVAASDRDAVVFDLSSGNCGDGPQGRKLLQKRGKIKKPTILLMDRAYEGNETRALAKELGYIPVVPPKRNRIDPWEYDKRLYKRRNEIERLFRRIKRFRRVFTRYDKLDVLYMAFVLLALIVDNLM